VAGQHGGGGSIGGGRWLLGGCCGSRSLCSRLPQRPPGMMPAATRVSEAEPCVLWPSTLNPGPPDSTATSHLLVCFARALRGGVYRLIEDVRKHQSTLANVLAGAQLISLPLGGRVAACYARLQRNEWACCPSAWCGHHVATAAAQLCRRCCAQACSCADVSEPCWLGGSAARLFPQ